MPITFHHLQKLKRKKEKIVATTAYDASFSRLFSTHGVEILLVGDTLGQVFQGNDNTLTVSMDEMIYHTRCVVRGNAGAFILSDMPFMSYWDSFTALNNAASLIRAGAQMVKLEGGEALCEIVHRLVQQGIPVCGHLGLTPQFVHVLGGYRVQGKTADSRTQILNAARALESAGIQLLVLECVPPQLAAEITTLMSIPVIGIGAGVDTDGQVLVSYDMLGLQEKTPRFVKNFMQEAGNLSKAVQYYVAQVKAGEFPAFQHCYTEG